MSLIRFSVARNRRFFALSIRKFEQKGESSQSARDETFETPESDAHPESKYGKGERKFKVDWSDKQQRWAHAAINSNPVIKPYHQKKEPFAAWEINEKEDKELRRINLGQKEIGAGGDIVAAEEGNETRIQKKIRQLEEDEKLRYYHVDEYKPKASEFFGVFTNLNVDYEKEAIKVEKWRKRLDFGHQIAMKFIQIICLIIIIDIALKIWGNAFVSRSDMNELQQLEHERALLRAQLAEGRNWVEDYDKKLDELRKIDQEIRVMETVAESAKTIKNESEAS